MGRSCHFAKGQEGAFEVFMLKILQKAKVGIRIGRASNVVSFCLLPIMTAVSRRRMVTYVSSLYINDFEVFGL